MADVPPLVAIKEANTHLQALHERNIFLEQEVVNLRAMLAIKKEQETRLLGQKQLLQEKDSEILGLQNEVNRLIKESQENTKKDLVISQLQRKVKLLNEIFQYKSALESITDCLEQVEQDFIVDIDNLVNFSNSSITSTQNGNNTFCNNNNTDSCTDKRLNDVNHETIL